MARDFSGNFSGRQEVFKRKSRPRFSREFLDANHVPFVNGVLLPPRFYDCD